MNRSPRRNEDILLDVTGSRVSHFQTVEEEARFWDTHSTTEFEDEFEPVSDVKFLVRRSPANRAITVRVDAPTLAKLVDQASRQGSVHQP